MVVVAAEVEDGACSAPRSVLMASANAFFKAALSPSPKGTYPEFYSEATKHNRNY